MSFAPTTHAAYEQGTKALENFAKRYGVVLYWPVSQDIILHFLADLSLSGKAFATARVYLAGIGAKHKLNNWPDPTKSFLASKLMKGLARSSPGSESRRPITIERLKQLVPCLVKICSNTYEALLFSTAFTVAFFGLFRISELLGQDKHLEGGRTGIQFSSVSVIMPRAYIFLAGSKTDQLKKGLKIVLDHVSSAVEICPVLNLSKYMHARPGKPGSLFVHLDGSQVTRYQFQAVLKKTAAFLGWEKQGFSAHSFRIGAATTAAANGVPSAAIMKIGRWKSDAYKCYIRQNLV